MRKILYVRSLMNFNKRVLQLGSMSQERKYTMKELKRKLWFNQIFMSNMEEVFQKHEVSLNLRDEYIDLLNEYKNNIQLIIECINSSGTVIDYSMTTNFEKQLLAYKIGLEDQIMIVGNDGRINFNYDGIYYISDVYIMDTDTKAVEISYIDKKRSVYNQILSYNDESDHTMICKADSFVRGYIEAKDTIDILGTQYHEHLHDAIRNTVTVKFTFNKKGKIVKIEYSGSAHVMELIERKCSFPESALIIKNEFMYTDDIERIIDSKINKIPSVKQDNENISFDDILQRDMIVEYPSTSFDVYLGLLREASKSKHVHSIYMTLYRIGKDPALYYILRDAVSNGKYVQVNIELKASGEEDINRFWMDEMRAVGINVTTYKSGKLKVHSKIALIRFFSGRSIAQIGTGNYHTVTTSQYTDLSLITSDRTICKEIYTMFELFRENPTIETDYKFNNKNFLVTRYNARSELASLIKKEADLGTKGYIAIKCNSLDDEEIIRLLNNAAKHGCRMDLIIRGVCTWLPDQIGSSINIKSIVWDKLEHSRVYCFGRINPKVYIGSLDLITHKLDKRIETLVRVKDPNVIKDLVTYMNTHIINSTDSWKLTSTGEYIREDESV